MASTFICPIIYICQPNYSGRCLQCTIINKTFDLKPALMTAQVHLLTIFPNLVPVIADEYILYAPLTALDLTNQKSFFDRVARPCSYITQYYISVNILKYLRIPTNPNLTEYSVLGNIFFW